MPTTADFYQKLTDVDNKLAVIETKLDTLHTDVTAVKTAVNQVNATLVTVNATLISGFNKLITLGQYANLALAQNAAQNDTIICATEHIARNTCEMLNQSVLQTALQTEIEESTAALADMYATTHADAALERDRLQALKAQMEECCPPPAPEPPCHYAPCPAPRPIGEPPKVTPLDGGKGATPDGAPPRGAAKG